MPCPACGVEVLDIDIKCTGCGRIVGASGVHHLIGRVMLGHYELLDVLGQGGMAVVFKARHRITQQDVALKILPPELAARSELKSRFVDEAKALASLDHPNIVHLYNFGEDSGHFVLAMQLVEGHTWERKILAAQRLDWAASCRIALDVLRALEYAHGRSVIHRDMKPSNVLVRARDGVATVMDFGIAKMSTSERLTETGQTMGTVRYMAPEQVRGQPVSPQTDLYAFGATLYESLTGSSPFDGSTQFDIMSKHLNAQPVPPSRRGVTLPAAVEDAVLRCLAKRPTDRFASARELRKQLEAAMTEAGHGLFETQPMELPELPAPTEPAGTDRPRAPRRAAPLVAAPAHKLRRSTRPRRAIARWLAVVLFVLAAAAGATATVITRKPATYRPRVDIAGVVLTKGATLDKLLIETDGTIEPVELAQLYHETLAALRRHVAGDPRSAAIAFADPVDVLLAVPARALCEPSAYLDHQPPRSCATARAAIAVGALGTHRLMVVSERAQLSEALRSGVAQAACEFAPLEDDQQLRALCDATSGFAEASSPPNPPTAN